MPEQSQLGSVQMIERTNSVTPVVRPTETSAVAVLLCVSEDPGATRGELMTALKRAGYDVDLVEASLHKVLNLQAKSYRAVLFDIRKPGGSGFELCRRIRERSLLPIMLVLHGLARNDALLGFQAGADAYMLAPFDEREFHARMRGLLQRSPVKPRLL